MPAIVQKQLVLDNGNTLMIPMRLEDGYINITLMCKVGGKKFSDWLKNVNVKNLIDNLSSYVVKLIYIEKHKVPYIQGNWIHPYLAIQLARWISPSFYFQVSQWNRDFLLMNSKKEVKELKSELYKLKKKYRDIIKQKSSHRFKKGKCFYIWSYPSDTKNKIGSTSDINLRLDKERDES